LINNILGGGGNAGFKRNNLYTGSGIQQGTRAGQELQPGEIDWRKQDISTLFTDPEKADLHLKAGSPAIDAGSNPVEYLPVKCFPNTIFTVIFTATSAPKAKAGTSGCMNIETVG
jgi:hypothetical protein